MKGNMFTNETDGRIQMILHFKLMQDNVWQEIAISTLYRGPFSADPLFGFNSIDLVAFGCVSSGLPKDVISHATTSDPPGVVKARSCFSIFSSSKKCCPKLKKGRRWRTSPPPVLEKKVVGNKGSNVKIYVGQGFRGKQFPYLNAQRLVFFCVFWYWEWLDWMRCWNNFSFFSGELGAVFFWEYLCHSPAIRCRASWKIAKTTNIFWEKTSDDFLGFAKNNSCDFHHMRQSVWKMWGVSTFYWRPVAVVGICMYDVYTMYIHIYIYDRYYMSMYR